MKYHWPTMPNDQKKIILKQLPESDIENIKLLKELFNANVIYLEINNQSNGENDGR